MKLNPHPERGANARAWAGEKGFTLVEVLVAMTILTIGIAGAIALIPRSVAQVQRAEEKLQCSELAASRLSQVRTLGAHHLFDKPNVGERLLNWFGEAFDVYEPLERRTVAATAIYDGYSGLVSRMAGANEVYLQRVSFSVDLGLGRRENFVTYVAQY